LRRSSSNQGDGVILKQELTARSAVVSGILAAAAWLLFVFVNRQVDLWTAAVLPAAFGLAVWLLGVGWIGPSGRGGYGPSPSR
jgi:hypothetical protein